MPPEPVSVCTVRTVSFMLTFLVNILKPQTKEVKSLVLPSRVLFEEPIGLDVPAVKPWAVTQCNDHVVGLPV